jgi:hypothetical protein
MHTDRGLCGLSRACLRRTKLHQTAVKWVSVRRVGQGRGAEARTKTSQQAETKFVRSLGYAQCKCENGGAGCISNSKWSSVRCRGVHSNIELSLTTEVELREVSDPFSKL